MERLAYDFRDALRAVLRRPLLATLVATSIAIGVGANATVFTAVNTLLLRALPGIRSPERVVEIGRTVRGRGFDTFSYPDFLDLGAERSTFDELAVWSFQSASVAVEGGGQRLMGMTVSASYFGVMGVTPALGRFFLAEEDITPGANPVVVLSHDTWRIDFDSDPNIVGRTISLSRRQFEVVGVAPPEFHGHVIAIRPDFYIPFSMGPTVAREDNSRFEERSYVGMFVVGRLADGVDVDQAQAVTSTVMTRLRETYPETNEDRGAKVVALGPVPAAGRNAVAAFLAALTGLVALLLLIICTNVAGMLLARGASREKEMAVRLALGSSRGRIIRQLVIESAAIFVVGGVAGLLFAYWATAALSAIELPVPIEVFLEIKPDARVLGAGLALALASGIVFGLIPALQVTKPSLAPVLKDDSGSGGSRASKLRRAFVMGQVGISLVLLVAAGLFLRSLQRAASTPIGFDPTQVLMTSVNLALEGYEDEQGRLFHDRILERLEAEPGVRSAAMSTDLPLDMGEAHSGIIPEAWEDRDDAMLDVNYNIVSADYFDVLDIAVLQGPGFGRYDTEDSPRAVAVNRTLAERVWPGESPIGKRVRFGSRDAPFSTVVALVDDVRNQTVGETVKPMVYALLAQDYRPSTYVIIKTEQGIAAASSIRSALVELDPALSMTTLVPLREYTSIGILPQRIAAGLTTTFGALALLLAGMGIYGVVAHAVTSQTREIGVRMALGAESRDVLRFIVWRGMLLAVPGLAVGALAAVAIGQVLRTFLLGVSPADPTVLIVAPLTLATVVAVASFVPAVRAARIDPVEALRYE